LVRALFGKPINLAGFPIFIQKKRWPAEETKFNKNYGFEEIINNDHYNINCKTDFF